MSGISWSATTTTHTWEEPASILVRVYTDAGGFVVDDLVGLRHGDGDTLEEAMTSWAKHVTKITEIPDEKLGEPLLSEVRRYRKALGVRP